MNVTKKIFVLLLSTAMLLCSLPMSVFATTEDVATSQNSKANENTIEIGDYITLGTYLGEPIVWRCVDIDDNGPLMLSDKILCFKAFDAFGENETYHSDGWGYIRKERGSNCWSDSNLRQWLNSSSATVDWSHCSPTDERVYQGYNEYADEAGFLTGFDGSELSMIKTVTQKSYINGWETRREGYCDGGSNELIYSVSSTPTNYDGYYYQNVTDKIFLLNPEQADATYQNFGNYLYNAYPTQSAVRSNEFEHTDLSADNTWAYWSGIPRNEGASYENQTLFGSANVTYAGTCSGYYGVRPAFYLNLDNYDDSYNIDVEDQNYVTSYIQDHVAFVNSYYYKNLMQNVTFYDSIMKNEDNSAAVAYSIWEYLGDIGEISTFNFNELIICDNPYDLILCDLFTNYATIDNFSSSVSLGILENVNSIYDNLLKIMRSSEEWDESYSNKLELEIKGIVFEPNYKVKDTNAYDIISKILRGLISDKKLESIFVGLNKIDTIYSYVDDTANILENFIKAYNAYVAAMGYLNAKNDILGTLFYAGYVMDPICGALYIDSLTTYLDIENADDAYEFALNELLEGSAWTAYDMIAKKFVQNGTYKFAAQVLGTTAGAIGLTTFVYNTTYSVLDYATALGDKGDLYKIMYASAKLEEAIIPHGKECASQLISNPTLEKAKAFDSVWSIIKNIEVYSYQALAKYAAKSSLSTRFINFFNPNYVSDDMIAPLYLSNIWQNASCHTENIGVDCYKAISVKCPTDVYIYKNNQLALSIINNSITKNDKSICAITINNQKYVSLPADCEYTIKVIATDDGTMDYSISEIQSMELTRYLEYENITLVDNKEYGGNISNAFNIDTQYYALTSSDTQSECTFDSTWGIHNDNDNHIFTTYISDNNATCTSYGTKTAWCDNNCGATNTITDESRYADHIVSDDRRRDSEYHWKICLNCKGEIDKEKHGFEIWNLVDQNTHKHSCECGECKTENHIFGDWVVTKEATESETGIKEKKCVCGHAVTEEIPQKVVETDPSNPSTDGNASNGSEASDALGDNNDISIFDRLGNTTKETIIIVGAAIAGGILLVIICVIVKKKRS